MVKDVRVMTGALRRVDDERWEVIYRAAASLYSAQGVGSRELAEQNLAKHKDALDAAGWNLHGVLGLFRGRVFAAFLLLSASCSSPTTSDVPPGAVRVNGTVQFYLFEGGFWAIRGDDGVTYDPLNGLSSAFQRENLRVTSILRIRHDLVGSHMVGPIVEIVSIAPL